MEEAIFRCWHYNCGRLLLPWNLTEDVFRVTPRNKFFSSAVVMCSPEENFLRPNLHHSTTKNKQSTTQTSYVPYLTNITPKKSTSTTNTDKNCTAQAPERRKRTRMEKTPLEWRKRRREKAKRKNEKKKQFLYKEKVQGHFWVFKKLLDAPAMLLGAPSNCR